MLVTKLGQHSIILGKPWMKKHGVILDMSCDKLMFWSSHCQHVSALENISKVTKLQRSRFSLNPTVEDALDKKELNSMPITATTTATTANSNSYPELLLHVLSKAKGIGKITAVDNSAYVIPQKRCLKPKAILPKQILRREPIMIHVQQKGKKFRPLDLAFVGKTSFKYLAKQKEVEIFSISIQDINERLEVLQEAVAEVTAVSADDINFQMNKTDNPPTNPKTVLLEEYHNFLDVFSKEASDIVAAHSKYNHRIRLLESHKGLGYSPLHGMS